MNDWETLYGAAARLEAIDSHTLRCQPVYDEPLPDPADELVAEDEAKEE